MMSCESLDTENYVGFREPLLKHQGWMMPLFEKKSAQSLIVKMKLKTTKMRFRNVKVDQMNSIDFCTEKTYTLMNIHGIMRISDDSHRPSF